MMYNLTQRSVKTTGCEELQSEFRAYVEQAGIDSILKSGTVIHAPRSVACAVVVQAALPSGRKILMKTFRHQPKMVRTLLGAWQLKREFRALGQLESLGFPVPTPIDLVHNDTLVETFVEQGCVLKSRKHYSLDSIPPPEFFRRLIRLVHRLHEEGFSYGDLHRGNIMIMPDQTPMMLDVATVVRMTSASSRLKRKGVKAFQVSDCFSLARIIESFYPELLDDSLRDALENPPRFLRLARFFRHSVYHPLMKKTNKRI